MSLWWLWLLLPVLIVLGFVILKIYLKKTTGWCKSDVRLEGKTAIVTGANTGIGYETALDLAKRGARVILVCRSIEKAQVACTQIRQESNNSAVCYKLADFSSFTSVRKLAEDILATESRLDILVNNAGAAGVGSSLTEDGLLAVMQINYYSPFLLTVLLLDLLKKSPSARIVNVASLSAKGARLDLETFNKFKGDITQYGISKLCNVMFTIELASRLRDTSVTTYSLHPGVVKTEIWRNVPYLVRPIVLFFLGAVFKSSVEGAQTTIYLAVEEGIEKFSGENFHDCRLMPRYASARDLSLAKKLWRKTEEILNIT